MRGSPDSAQFRFTRTLPVRFRDLDPMGHAHHSLPLIYIEEVRAAYWREVVGRNGLDEIDYVLGQVTLRYRQRILFPATLTIALRVSRVGRSSFVMEYEIRDEADTLLVTAETVQIMYDYEAGRSKPMPEDIRRRIRDYEGMA